MMKLQKKTIRYLWTGSLIFGLNSLFLWLGQTPTLTEIHHLSINQVHVVVIEISIFFSFILHNYVTWQNDSRFYIRKFFVFHLVTLVTLTLRVLVFWSVIHLGFRWEIAFTLSVSLIIIMNFLGFDLFVFRDPKTILSDNQDIYHNAGEGTSILESIEEASQYNSWLAGKMTPYLGEWNLEIGAGLGTIAEIVSQSHQIDVTEISKSGHAALARRFENNSQVRHIYLDFLAIQEDETYDAIYSSNVLEHLEDDLLFITHAYKLLKPGGRFIAILPAGDWLYSKLDKKIGHYRRYSYMDKIRLTKFFHQEGQRWCFKKFRFFNPIGAAAWYLKYRLLGSLSITQRNAMAMNDILPFISWIDWFYLPFGQSVILVLEKQAPTDPESSLKGH